MVVLNLISIVLRLDAWPPKLIQSYVVRLNGYALRNDSNNELSVLDDMCLDFLKVWVY